MTLVILGQGCHDVTGAPKTLVGLVQGGLNTEL